MTYKTKNATIVFAFVAMLMVAPLTVSNANADETISSMTAACGYDTANITMPAITRLAEQTQATEAFFTLTDGENTKGGSFSVKATTNWQGDGDRATTTVQFANPTGRVLSLGTLTAGSDITAGTILTITQPTGSITNVFTAVAGAAIANQFTIDGVGQTADLTDLVRAINADATLVTAAIVGDIVTLTAKVGTTAALGDAITVVQSVETDIDSITSPLAGGVQGDSVTINSLEYRAAVGAKVDNTEFSMDGSNLLDAEALSVSVNARDTNVRATHDNTDTVTVNAFVRGAGGNAFTITESPTSARITIPGGGVFTGGGANVKDHLDAEHTKFEITTTGLSSTGTSYANKHAFNAKDTIKEMAGLTSIIQPVRVSLQTSTVATASGTGTITVLGLNAGDTVTVNGLVYTAVAGGKANDQQFTIDTSNSNTATDLADSIDDDTRKGLFGDVTAIAVGDVVTVTAAVAGTFGNNVAFAESTGGVRYTAQAGLTGGAEPLKNLPYDGALKMTVVYTVNCT